MREKEGNRDRESEMIERERGRRGTERFPILSNVSVLVALFGSAPNFRSHSIKRNRLNRTGPLLKSRIKKSFCVKCITRDDLPTSVPVATMAR